MISYWEQESFLAYDHIVVGAGITGLSTAISLRSLFPQDRILVLERSLFSTGASSRNAGFACTGSATELLDDLESMSEEEVKNLFLLRKTGLEKLRKRLGDQAIGYEASGSFELIRHAELPVLDKLDYLNQLLYEVAGQEAFRIADKQIASFGFSPSQVLHLIENTCEGALHTGKMLRALTDYAIEQRIEIKTGAQVTRFDTENAGIITHIEDPFRKQTWQFSSRTLSICTNAFTKHLLPESIVNPGRGQVCITDPIPGLHWKGIFHFDKGYYYFREVDQRILIGGGRNMDFEGETTEDFGLHEKIQQDLEDKLRSMIIPHTPIRIAQRWSGIMAFGDQKKPILQSFAPGVFGAFRMGGMGVALGTEIAQQLAEKIHHYCQS